MMPTADMVAEGRRLVKAAQAEDLTLRLLGGVAISTQLGERLHPVARRVCKDLDFVTAASDGPGVVELLLNEGYTPNQEFNQLHGRHRLLFWDELHNRQVDVFVGRFQMCHNVPLGSRLLVEPLTLPLAELALTKLQIVRLNVKDQTDLIGLFHGCALADDDHDAINRRRVGEVCSRDWGLYETCRLNLALMAQALAAFPIGPGDRTLVASRITALAEALNEAPKTRGWRLRARIGSRVRWYEDPEEVAL